MPSVLFRSILTSSLAVGFILTSLNAHSVSLEKSFDGHSAYCKTGTSEDQTRNSKAFLAKLTSMIKKDNINVLNVDLTLVKCTSDGWAIDLEPSTFIYEYPYSKTEMITITDKYSNYELLAVDADDKIIQTIKLDELGVSSQESVAVRILSQDLKLNGVQLMMRALKTSTTSNGIEMKRTYSFGAFSVIP